MTLIEAITAHGARLESAGVCFGQGTSNAFDEAAWLALWSIGLPLDVALDDHAARPLSAGEAAALRALVERRIATRRPAAYLTGEAWLQGVPFQVDERVIVPRSFIAELIADGSIDAWLTDRARRVLDLCTGSGSLAVLAALAWPDVVVDAADLSADALDVARLNVERHRLEGRVTLLRSDLFDAIDRRYELIVCNPPYVNAASMARLPPEFHAEPALALAGGIDGMDLVRRIVHDAPARMNDDAVLVLEVGHERAHFEAAFPRLETVWLETSAGADQVLLLTRDALLRGPR